MGGGVSDLIQRVMTYGMNEGRKERKKERDEEVLLQMSVRMGRKLRFWMI